MDDFSHITLPSGEMFNADENVIGLRADDLSVFSGYDNYHHTFDLDSSSVSKYDKIFLADLMIRNWQRYKEKALEDK